MTRYITGSLYSTKESYNIHVYKSVKSTKRNTFTYLLILTPMHVCLKRSLMHNLHLLHFTVWQASQLLQQ